MAVKSKKQVSPYVVVRTYSAGVHCGEMIRREGREVALRNARRIWKWMGALTLNEVATKGVASGSRVSCEVPEILVTEAIEVISCSEAGEKNLRAAQWTA